MTGLPARHLLTPVPLCGEDDFFQADWNMNLYRGCCHGCIYCDTRSVCYRVEDFEQIASIFLGEDLRHSARRIDIERY